MGIKREKLKYNLVALFFSIFVVVFALFPFYYAVLTSFKSGQELFEVTLLIKGIDFGNYRELFEAQNFARIIINSFAVAFLTVFISTSAGLFAAYALGRISFRGKKVLLYSVLAISMFPQIAVLSGLYTLLQTLGLFNNVAGLSFSYMIFTLPFTIWVLTSFVQKIPAELDESAQIDGATPFQIVMEIYTPLLAPSIVTTAMLSFIAAWNEFLFALTFTVNEKARTVPVAISLISGSSQYELPFGVIMAASVVVTVPLVVMVLLFQKRIVSGLTAGALK